jgi:hypothetical protein
MNKLRNEPVLSLGKRNYVKREPGIWADKQGIKTSCVRDFD